MTLPAKTKFLYTLFTLFIITFVFSFVLAPPVEAVDCTVSTIGKIFLGSSLRVTIKPEGDGKYFVRAFSKPSFLQIYESEHKQSGFLLGNITFDIPGSEFIVAGDYNIAGYKEAGSSPISCDPATGLLVQVATSSPGTVDDTPTTTFPGSGGAPTVDIPFFGPIPVSTNPSGFATRVLQTAIGFAGGLAFILMAIAAFRMTTSAGNPDNLQSAREMFTAAIIGLIVIVFSIFLLRLIGITILRIPGFA
ncbi:MAG: hypothetical protein A2134_01300 [Candidatus Woykebacteria bacterium RBG_16_39_9b]|uniref:Uncharacterized protein n=1 Tax=Candidatus Woykebacteria bacterium RBG_16_39_9b TaxID=1802595 RepID=A0A1G1WBD3_9BACT|nr:MAG: hypothetical protein A2134_01300 [Candidatus Woykebacteria bacterium RBG_16_39_9b]